MTTLPHRRVRKACVAGLAALTLVAACSSGDSSQSDAEDSSGGPDGADSTAEEPAAAPVRVVTLNLLHGFFCPPETDACQAPDRVGIFTELVEAADCPDLIGLQEIGARLEELLPPAVARLCDGVYTIAWKGGEPAIDREMVLTRLPTIDQGHLDIANFPWEAYWVRAELPGSRRLPDHPLRQQLQQPALCARPVPIDLPGRHEHQRVPRHRGRRLLRTAAAGRRPIDRVGRPERGPGQPDSRHPPRCRIRRRLAGGGQWRMRPGHARRVHGRRGPARTLRRHEHP
jgi:hypothetical protein